MSKNIAITIARQYGSGGREIGDKVAKILGIPTYDKELITMAAKTENMNEEVLAKVDETATSSLLYTLAMGSNLFGLPHHSSPYTLPLNDKLFVLQSEVIRNLAAKESAVMIGRCADYVLREHPHRLSVFVYADIANRKRRVASRHDITENEALDIINKTDRRRSSYYNFYTGGKWGKYDNYHIAINSSKLGIEGTAMLIADMAKRYMAD